MLTVGAIAEYLGEVAPLSLAADWDNVGLLLGDAAAPVKKVMTCLTVTAESAAEAVADGAGLIVSHHPIFFRPSKRLTAATAEGRMLLSLARAGVAVYSPHTAFDNAPGGINDTIARRLELRAVTPLLPQEGPRQCKLVVFVPDQDLAKVSDALFAAGAGRIGQYSECSFRLAGTGTFFGSEATNPTVGEKGRREEVSEWRLEAICPEANLAAALAAMRKAHSYEEPAYDVYPLRPERHRLGIGRFGTLAQPTSLKALAAALKTKLSAASVQVVGESERMVQRVAIVCGAGGDFVSAAVAQKADVLLTGEARFHECLKAQGDGLSLVLPGHFASERPGIEELAGRLQGRFPSLAVWASKRETDPLR